MTALLGPADVRALADRLGVRPTKTLGQNFVHDAGTVTKIVAAAHVQATDHVLEVGPGLGSLTLALLATGARVTAIEIDPTLAQALPHTIAERAPAAADRCTVLPADALTITGPADLPSPPPGGPHPQLPNRLVANLPYNVAVPVLLTLLPALPSLREVLVMVQAEVAHRLCARPGSRVYGVPSVKAAWYGQTQFAGLIGRNVFWPVPNVDSALVRLLRHDPPATPASREQVFALVDAAFAQRRKTLRAALGASVGSPARAEEALRAAGIDPALRGEKLTIDQFAALAAQLGEWL
ncbi:16S rRNA (adenine(1518)-N(6)/adenine(1519)-N(6))-dimethyltransferase RsmA [Buchananella hordeovulneris]|uniref:Ribosomal RNA small subunit methyltransferase A n=1 Tax=Buchananella hordeovulneris TaxID=52770 RepID=A0A1Q5PTS1_9ACTO|nr:16S rRNA (adenine(1518)-N(6)/adenine(1519)-N(6))-dimethyltransferase RsmA [Buchananella hordeovulneris]OKL50991.1 16S rRNA (adenine(1518)-N(6)/adenine(1519)-N(6))-dimethyltransferase [Buchananella hordeovulneris]